MITDRIHAVIAQFEAANNRLLAALEWHKKDARAAAPECDAAYEALQEAANKLVYGTPTTMGGTATWFDYIISFDNPELFWPISSDGAECYESVASFHQHVLKVLKQLPGAA